MTFVVQLKTDSPFYVDNLKIYAKTLLWAIAYALKLVFTESLNSFFRRNCDLIRLNELKSNDFVVENVLLNSSAHYTNLGVTFDALALPVPAY